MSRYYSQLTVPVAPVAPLSAAERGRGVVLGAERTTALERYCAQALSSGLNQKDIGRALSASRSRVSRWCVSGLRQFGIYTDHRLLNEHHAKSLTQMMWSRIVVGGKDECWPWRGVIKPNGYGSLTHEGTAYNAHRLVFETLVCRIPDRLVLDHTCNNRSCVNPAHLQVTTQAANTNLAAMRRAG